MEIKLLKEINLSEGNFRNIPNFSIFINLLIFFNLSNSAGNTKYVLKPNNKPSYTLCLKFQIIKHTLRRLIKILYKFGGTVASAMLMK